MWHAWRNVASRHLQRHPHRHTGSPSSPSLTRPRGATGLIQPGSNAGPAFAAVAIAFNNDPLILGAVSSILFMQIIVGTLAAGYLGKDRPDEDDAAASQLAEETTAKESHA